MLWYTIFMATNIYDTETVQLVDGTEIRISPLKIAYLREFMDKFSNLQNSNGDISLLLECVLSALKQYHPSIRTIEDVEDSLDIQTVYTIVDVAAGISVKGDEQKESSGGSGTTWESLDLAKLEAEAFLLGIWKDYDELEKSMSMPELIATLEIKRESEYSEKKFLAAMQGVDLDKQSGNTDQNAWEKMKAKYFSNGATDNPNDVLSLQGANAQKAGFGIGMGLDYERIS